MLMQDRAKWKGRPLQPWFPCIAQVTSSFLASIQHESDLAIVWDACSPDNCTTDAFIITFDSHVQAWRERNRHVRENHPLNAKVVEYKSLGDGVRWRALPDTLTASDGLQGLLLALNIPDGLILPDSELGGMVDHLKSIEVLKYDWKAKEFRKMYRVTSTVAWLIAQCAREGQHVRFLSDEDNIWNNNVQQEDVERMLSILCDQACLHGPGKTTWSTYCSHGRYSMLAEDLVAIADRAAGVVGFVAGETRKLGPSVIQFPHGKRGQECAREERLSRWFWASDSVALYRIALVVEGDDIESANAKLLACAFN